jgi:hypothetical protein
MKTMHHHDGTPMTYVRQWRTLDSEIDNDYPAVHRNVISADAQAHSTAEDEGRWDVGIVPSPCSSPPTAVGMWTTPPMGTGAGIGLFDGSRPIDPVFGPSVAMSNGENPDHLVPNNVGNVVREYLEINPPISAGSQAWHFDILRNPGDVLIHLLPESQAQSAPQLRRPGLSQRPPNLRLHLSCPSTKAPCSTGASGCRHAG